MPPQNGRSPWPLGRRTAFHLLPLSLCVFVLAALALPGVAATLARAVPPDLVTSKPSLLSRTFLLHPMWRRRTISIFLWTTPYSGELWGQIWWQRQRHRRLGAAGTIPELLTDGPALQ